jgi:hypothetical protein
MSLDFDLPSASSIRRQAESQGRAELTKLTKSGRAELTKLTKRGVREVAKALPALPSLPAIPTSPEEAIRMGLREAGLPDSPEAAVGLIMKEAGASVPFPIPIPLPESVGAAVLMGVEWAAQAYGPQVLAMIGLGSVVPGIGNAAGLIIGVAKLLADQGFAPAAVPRRAWECKSGYNYPPGIKGVTPILQMADAQTELIKVKNHRLVHRKSNYISGSRLGCDTRKTKEIKFLHRLVVGSEKTATMPEINLALLAFDQYKKLGIRQAISFEPGSKQVVQALKGRRAGMFKLAADVRAFMKAPPATTRGQISQKLGRLGLLERRVLAEVRIASIGVVRTAKDPSMKKKNLQQLAGYTRSFDTLNKVKQALIRQMNVAAGGKKEARTQTGNRAAMMRFEMDNCGGNAACEAKVRSRYGVAAPSPRSTAPRPAPTRTAPARARRVSPKIQQRQKIMAAMAAWKNWLRGARSDQVARRPVRPPPPIGPRNPPGTPPAWAKWLAQARAAQAARRRVPFPPGIPAAWVR